MTMIDVEHDKEVKMLALRIRDDLRWQDRDDKIEQLIELLAEALVTTRALRKAMAAEGGNTCE
jgi:hypothetical protein